MASKTATSTRLWYEALPTPRATPSSMSVAELHALSMEQRVGKAYVVVDVRRTDIDEAEHGRLLPVAINLPAQTFYHTLPVIFQIVGQIPKVIFHCSSSRGRGPRCAAWYQDYLDDQDCRTSKSYVLEGGIKAWCEAFPEETVTV
ncbi:hypothetical protein BCR39DRAFT_461149 [Naematelia encephala]|uniref:Rhodanese domain-containing protein n=1 Tax=Naematelia encephala TaxID=71784 RepID=A0A1Y2BMK4_9TREE|nr:hypothetical protein BCR39DRAFT_461149 [Naematelia encephala]